MQNSPQKILIVDDDPMSCKVFKIMLTSLGYDVHHVPHGNAAHKAMLAQNFDLVLLDWTMPVMNGAETLSLIRNGEAGEHHADIPLIVVTADLARCPKENCLEAGATDYLTKPTDLRKLTEMISELLN